MTFIRTILTATLLCNLAAISMATDWPQFRGPDGQGHSTSENPPTEWDEHTNVTWRTVILGSGWSSPAIQGNQIWMTVSRDRNRSLRAVCVDRESGEIIHDVEVFRLKESGRVHSKNGHASPTPIVAGDKVFVHFGTYGTACLKTDGTIVWKAQIPYYHHHGPASTPVLVDDLLIVNCDGFTTPAPRYVKNAILGFTNPQFVVALDAATGKQRWKANRPLPSTHAYSTPLLIEVNGRRELLSPGANALFAYDPTNGAELWRCRFEGYSVVPRPVFAKGLVLFSTGYDVAQMYAVRPGGTGDVTETHIAWTEKQGAPLNPSPLVVGADLFLVSDSGIATCRNVTTGELIWRERLGGKYSASPVHAGGYVYFLSETGTAHVIKAARTFEKVSTNKIQGQTFASPAIVDDAMFLRSDRALYRIEAK